MQFKLENLAPKPLLNIYPSEKAAPDNAVLLADLPENCSDELSAAIMRIKGVKRCLITDVLFSVALNESANPEEVEALVLAEADDFFASGKKLPAVIFKLPETDSGVLKTAEALADSFIRPTLNRDKGDIKFLNLQNNVLTVKFTGHCSGCPYAQNTLNNVVSSCLRRYLPQLEIKVSE